MDAVRHILSENRDITSVIMVHYETSTGVIHPVNEVGKAVKEILPQSDFIVDAMSSFGGIPLDLRQANIDFMISSANKCIEGVPGFAYVICRKERLLECEGRSKSLSMDLVDQYLTLERTGLFRFTAPTHAMLAFQRALIEYEEEGGLGGRAARYVHSFLQQPGDQLNRSKRRYLFHVSRPVLFNLFDPLHHLMENFSAIHPSTTKRQIVEKLILGNNDVGRMF